MGYKADKKFKMYTLNELRSKMDRVDAYVADGYFPTRSEAVRMAIFLLLEYMDNSGSQFKVVKENTLPDPTPFTAGELKEEEGKLYQMNDYGRWNLIGRLNS